jgi:hypothetical protein
MKLNDDPNKRPLLTAEQRRIISRRRETPRKGTPREEFEKLFRPPYGAGGANTSFNNCSS